ncbi:hypothetical protein QYH69_25830 [Paraburkholderia sp. SARCC-3016]|nr:hypothetical protein [Paraburkholderia sp. SARCC-3016]MDQ7980663.1 hypothetical protein [Paraburkholderia sp. SARCC-3016]
MKALTPSESSTRRIPSPQGVFPFSRMQYVKRLAGRQHNLSTMRGNKR